MILSLVVIIVISFVKNDSLGYALAFATTLGAVCQIITQFPKLRQIGYRIKPNLKIKNNKEFKSICELLFPAILSSTIGQISIYIDMFFASTLIEGAWTSVVFANRIFQFPVGILVTAFLVPLFPIFSRLVGEKNIEGIQYYFNKGVGVLFFVSFPMIIMILLLAQDGISLIFERGAFDSNAVNMVSKALCFLSISIIPYVFRDSITRVYYAFNDSKTPFLIAISSIGLKAILNWILIIKMNMSIAGITLSTSFITLINATLLGLLIKGKIKLDYKTLFGNFGKMLISAIITYVLGWFVYKTLGYADTTLFKIVRIAAVIMSTSILYVLLNIVFRMDYAKELLTRLKR